MRLYQERNVADPSFVKNVNVFHDVGFRVIIGSLNFDVNKGMLGANGSKFSLSGVCFVGL